MWLTAREIEKITASLGRRIASSNVVDWSTKGHVSHHGEDPIRYLLQDVLTHAEKVVRRPGRQKTA